MQTPPHLSTPTFTWKASAPVRLYIAYSNTPRPPLHLPSSTSLLFISTRNHPRSFVPQSLSNTSPSHQQHRYFINRQYVRQGFRHWRCCCYHRHRSSIHREGDGDPQLRLAQPQVRTSRSKYTSPPGGASIRDRWVDTAFVAHLPLRYPFLANSPDGDDRAVWKLDEAWLVSPSFCYSSRRLPGGFQAAWPMLADPIAN